MKRVPQIRLSPSSARAYFSRQRVALAARLIRVDRQKLGHARQLRFLSVLTFRIFELNASTLPQLSYRRQRLEINIRCIIITFCLFTEAAAAPVSFEARGVIIARLILYDITFSAASAAALFTFIVFATIGV